METVAFTLQPKPPYDFNLTAAYATYFHQTYASEIYQNGVFHRLIDEGGNLYLARVSSEGTLETPRLEVNLTGPRLDNLTVVRAKEQMAWILATDQDLVPFYFMAKNDRTLSPLVRTLYGLHIPHTASIYEGLVLAIIGQQISSNVARMLRTLLVNTYGPSLDAFGTVYHGFPHPTDLLTAGVIGLRKVKFSARKAQYIVDISSAVTSGQLDLERLKMESDEEAIRVFTGIRGVGLWTVQWLFIRSLARSDGFPHTDLALCRAMGQLLHKKAPLTPEASLELSRRWSPYRSFVTSYIFAAIRSGVDFLTFLSPRTLN